MSPQSVNAQPTKRFFIDNFTRDLTLEDVVLDLIDNSIDSFIRLRKIDLNPDSLLGNDSPFIEKDKAVINLIISPDRFVIEDMCGGIDIEYAKYEVFRFGRTNSSISSSLGIYGIGLKRAIFKIGRDIIIESRTIDNGFRVDIDVDEWISEDDNWTFKLTPGEKATSIYQAGTTITISRINPDISTRISDPTFLKRLKEFISISYSLFLSRYVNVKLNGYLIEPTKMPITGSEKISTAVRTFNYDNVHLELFTGLSDRKSGWNTESAGWYIVCNGRVVVNADKTSLTGWGLFGPQYVSKYRAFLGLAFFFCADPAKLPWTTTKRGLNVESMVYQQARKEMAAISRPVFTFLNDMYTNEDFEEVEERKVVETLEPVQLKDLRSKPNTMFTVSMEKSKKSNYVTVQYKVDKSKIDKIKKRINKPNLSAGNVGLYTFDYFIKNECPE
jgi:hypothetical protein